MFSSDQSIGCMSDNGGQETVHSLALDALILEGFVPPDQAGPARQSLLNKTLQLAIEALENGDAIRAENMSAMTMYLGQGAGRASQADYASVIRAYIRLCMDRPEEAIPLLQLSRTAPVDLLARSHSNLGYAYAHLRQPHLAIEHLSYAIELAPTLIFPRLSRRNLALTLLDEDATAAVGRPGWLELTERDNRFLKSLREPHIRRQLDAPFDKTILVFDRHKYLPAISSQVSPRDATLSAGDELLSRARLALHAEEYDLAEQLARAGGKTCRRLKQAADAICTKAAHERSVQNNLDDARKFAGRAEHFHQNLKQVSVGNLDAARSTLSMLRPYDETYSESDAIYTQTVLKALYRALSEAGEVECQSRLLQLAAHFSTHAEQEALAEASRLLQAQPLLSQFWSAINEGNVAIAKQTLTRLGGLLPGEGFAPLRANCHAVLDLAKGDANESGSVPFA